MAYRNYGPASGFVVSQDNSGDFKTIGAALTAAAGKNKTIFIKPGTYTEDNTITATQHLVAFDTSGQSSVNNVIIVGKFTISSASIILSISGVNLTTNGDNIINVSGAGSQVQINNCNIAIATAVTGFVSSNATSNIQFNNCVVDCVASGVFYAVSGGGAIAIDGCEAIDTNGTIFGTSTNANSAVYIFNSWLSHPLSCTGSGVFQISYTQFGFHLGSQNTTWLTIGGSISWAEHCEFYSGTASAISVSSGGALNLSESVINSSNTNAITGLGTLNIGVTTFTGSSSNINTSTIVYLPTIPTPGSLVKLATYKPSGVSSLAMTSVISASYTTYYITYSNLQPVTSGQQFLFQVSSNNGSSYIATGYQAGLLVSTYNNVTGTLANANSTTSGILSFSTDNTTFSSGELWLYNVGNGAPFQCFATGLYSASATLTWATSLTLNSSTAVNAIQFYCGSGNITSGTFTIYGLAQ